MVRIFVCYDPNDRLFRNKLIGELSSEHDEILWHNSWSADLPWWDKILDQIAECEMFLFCLRRILTNPRIV